MYLHRVLRNCGSILALLLFASVIALPQGSGQANILTNKMDNSRSGLNPNETKLNRTNVTYTLFGKLFAANVDGYIQAQPLYMSNLVINGGTHNVVFVATQNNSIYAFDADTGAQLWFQNLGANVPNNAEGCNNVTGFNGVGILGTPVIDPTTNTMYLTAKTFNSVTHVATHSLHAIDVTTGLEKFGGSVDISATIGSLTFNGLAQLQRPGLLLVNGVVYIGFGSNGCDFNARGWLFAYQYNGTTLAQLAVMTTQPDNSYGSSIWQSGVGPAADSAGNVYLATANGQFQYSTMDFGDSVLKLSLSGNQLWVDDYFTPYDQANMQTNDLDLGSSGVTLLPVQTGSSTPNLLVTSGKDADIYLINTDNLGQYNPSGNTQIPQYLPNALGGEFFGNPIFWNNNVYFLARQDYLRSYALSVNASGNSVLTANAQTSLKLTNYGEPVLSSNGLSNGIVWLVRNIKGVPLLSAYDATGLYLIYDSGQASGGRDTLGVIGHFTNPIVANGKVYAGTQTQLVAYGLFPQINATGGGGQSGTVGTTLPNPISITAINPYTGKAISGVSVTFSDNKGGKFGTNPVTTDNNGKASTTYTLPTSSGTVTVTGASPGYSTASFTETATAGPVATLTLVSGGKQIGTVGTTLPLPIVMRAKDTYGNVVSGASVSFTDNANKTSVFTPQTATTDSSGQATTMYTLPTIAQSLIVTGTVGSVTGTASEQSVAGPPTAINIVQGNNQTAGTNTKLPKALGVAVVDQYQNGVSGITVTFQDNNAGGIFSPSNSAVTNSNGQASVSYTTGSTPGTVIIDCTYSTLVAPFTETVN